MVTVSKTVSAALARNTEILELEFIHIMLGKYMYYPKKSGSIGEKGTKSNTNMFTDCCKA